MIDKRLAALGTVGVKNAKKLAEAAHLGWCLVALDRADEARALVDRVADEVSFTGDQALWSPASASVVLSARLATDPARRAALLARLVEHPAVAEMSRTSFDQWIQMAGTDLTAARAEETAKWAVHRAGSACIRAAYFRETDGAGCYYDGWVDRAALDEVIEGALALIRERLAEEPGSRPRAKRSGPGAGRPPR